MPFYKGTIYKQFALQPNSKQWTNVYNLEAADEEAALLVLGEVLAVEQEIHYDNINFTKMAVRQDTPLAGAGRQAALAETGNRAGAGLQFLPSFNTVRVIFTDSVNRPDQKYLRLLIAEGEQENGALDSGLVSTVLTDYGIPIMAIGGVVSSSHVAYTNAGVDPDVQMRQRSWSRRTRPGFHRGWVPD